MTRSLSAMFRHLRLLGACSGASALMLVPLQAIAIGDVWQQRTPLPTAESLNSVLHTGTQWVGVGQKGTVITSADASTWTTQSAGTTAALRSIAWSGSQLLAVGDDGTFITSPDGVTWTAATSPLSTRWNAVVWTGSLFTALGDDGATATSLDGTVWTLRLAGGITNWQGAAFSSGLIVAVGSQGSIVTSPDGVTLSTPTSPTTRWLRAVAHSGTRWVAVGDAGVIITSTDASAWSTTPSGVSLRLRHVLWDGSQFIALGDDGTALTSTDGLSWTAQTTGMNAAFAGASSAGGLLVTVADRGSIVTTANVTTPWVEHSTGSREWIHDTVWTGSQFVAVGSSGLVETSPEGTTWTPRTSGTTASLNGITWTGNRLVAVGNTGVVISSTDGITWTPHSSGTTRPLFSVAYTGIQVIAVGLRGTVTTSPDGQTWSTSTLGSAPNLRAISATGSQIIAVGDSGAIVTYNGSVWTTRTSGVGDDLTCVATNGSLAIAGGESGNIVTSTNLSTWTTRSPPLNATTTSGLHCLRWTGSEFIAVGHGGGFFQPRGYLIHSLDGTSWILRPTNASEPLSGIASSNTITIVAGAVGLTLSNDVATLPIAELSPSSASITEEGGVQTLTVTLSSVASGTIIVPAAISGTAIVGTDANVSVVPLIITTGQTTASMTITGIGDLTDEPDKTLIITLGSPLGATLGIATISTITILDDDTPPIFGPPPLGEIVVAGTAVSFTTTVTGGEPLTFQWLRNEVAVSKAISTSYSLPSASVSQAGGYRLQAKNPSATVKSDIAELGVVDGTSKSLSYIAGATATLTISAGGNGLSYQWQRNERDLTNDSRTSGATDNKLVIKTLTGQDSGVYRCLVSNVAGSVLGGSNTISVTSKPFIAPMTFDTVMVSQSMFVPVFAGNQPTRYTVSSLPSGVTYSNTTGFISGRPLVASGTQPFQVKISASNAAGSSPVITVPLTVLPLTTGTNGGFLGTINRVNGLNAKSALGGRITLTVASNGKVTGSAWLGATTHSFTTTLNTAPLTNPTATTSITRTGFAPLTVVLNSDPAQQQITGTLSDGIVSTSFLTQRVMASPFTSYTGYYTAALKLANVTDEGQENIPQGYGYAYFTVGSTGTATGALRLADGTQFALSTALRSNGALVIYAPLYGSTGSVLGTMSVTPGSPALVSTSGLDWFKATQVNFVRSYRDTFGPVALDAVGAIYTSPTDIVMNLVTKAEGVPNTALQFSEGGAPSPATRLNVQLRYSKTVIRDPQTPATNPGNTTIAITASKGLLSGGFNLTDTDVTTGQLLIRKSTWNSIIARDIDGVLRGFGHFQLAKMPQNSLLPITTKDTSPLLSGKVSLLPLP